MVIDKTVEKILASDYPVDKIELIVLNDGSTDKTAEILDRLCEETFSKLAQKMHAINADPSNPLDGLRRGLRTYIQFGIDNPNHYIVTFVQAKQIPEHQPKAGEQCFENLRGAVGRCVEAGQLNCEDVEEVEQALWAARCVMTPSFYQFPFIK
jgi:cellulose synthase/poly-beta-1,6-N-acetylglucosamine synthase-like glycosyltransferase